MCYNYGMDREHDIRLIEQEMRDPNTTPKRIAILKHQIHLIRNESQKVKSMRKELLKAHQEGNIDEINDIREWAEHHREYRNS